MKDPHEANKYQIEYLVYNTFSYSSTHKIILLKSNILPNILLISNLLFYFKQAFGNIISKVFSLDAKTLTLKQDISPHSIA